MSRLFLFLAFSFFPGFSLTASAQVANSFNLPLAKGSVQIKARQYYQIPVNTQRDDTLEIDISVFNSVYKDIGIYVCSQQALLALQQGRARDCRGVSHKAKPFHMSHNITSNGLHYVVLDNRHAGFVKKKLTYSITARRNVDDNMKRELIFGLQQTARAISQGFAIPPIKLGMPECGRSNAYSVVATGDIALCIELVHELATNNLPFALQGILFHEIGHSVLRHWGVPGSDNEELVDEFAVALALFFEQPGIIIQLAEFFAKSDSWAEARHIVQFGDNHPISAQRVRNLKRLATKPQEVKRKWAKLFAKYAPGSPIAIETAKAL